MSYFEINPEINAKSITNSAPASTRDPWESSPKQPALYVLYGLMLDDR
jgi:hypothetical protein